MRPSQRPTSRALAQGLLALAALVCTAAASALPAPPPAASAPAARADGVALEAGAQGMALVARSGGRLDLRFGEGGRTVLEGMAAQQVLTDTRGFHHVIGQRQGLPPRLEVRRFVPAGRPDTAWGDQGRASGALVDGAAARQGLLLPDGRLLVAGEVERLNPQAALWWVSADGRIDTRWLMLEGAASSRVMSVLPTDGGAVMLGLLTGGPQGAMLEVHLWTPSRDAEVALPERIGRQPLPKGWSASPVLQRRDKGWFWVDPEAPQPQLTRVAGTDGDEDAGWQRRAGPLAAPQAATPVTAEPGGALYSPWATPSAGVQATPSPAKPIAAETSPASPSGVSPWLLGVALVLGSAALLRRLLRAG